MNAEVPPHDLDAELAFLGAVLLLGDADAATVEPSAFYSDKHRSIYEAIHAAKEAGERIDALTVGKRVPALRSILLDAQNACVLPSSAPDYADIVTEKARLRAVERAARLLIASVHEDAADADSIEADAVATFASLQNTSGGNALTLKDLVSREIEALHKPQEFVTVPGMSGIALYGGDLVVIGGRPGHGKSALSMQLALEWSRTRKTAFFSYEMGESQVGRRIISRYSGLSLSDMNAGFQSGDGDTVRALMGDSLNGRDFTFKMCGGMSPRKLFTSLRRFAAGGGKVAVIDYLQLAARAKAGTIREDVTVFTADLKQVALQTGLLIVAPSQLRRPDDERALKLPTLSELRESGSIEQDADVVFLMMTLPSLRRDEKAQDLAQKILTGYPVGVTAFEVGDDPDDDKRLVLLDAAKARQGRLSRRPFIFDGACMNFEAIQRGAF